MAVANSVDGEIARVVFSKEIAGLESTVLGFGQICELVSEIYFSSGSESIAASGCQTGSTQTLAAIMADMEQRFKDAFRSDVLQVDPQGAGTRIKPSQEREPRQYLKDIRSESMLPNLALRMVLSLADLLGEKLSDDEAWRHALRVAKLFRAPLEIHRSLWERVAMNGFDIDHPKKHRGNFHWDMSISAIAGGDIDGQPVRLVTSDKAIIQACLRAGYGDNVMDTAAYRALISI